MHYPIAQKTVAPRNFSNSLRTTLLPGDSDSAEEAEEEGEHRDRGKARKYKKLHEAKAIPEHIAQMIEEESKKQNKPRQYKTDLINKLFVKTSKGDYTMKPHQPVFETFKETMHKRFGRDETEGTPRAVFLWSTFQGNKQALEAAIEEGAVKEWKQDGVEFCAFRKTTAGVEATTSQTSKLGTGETKMKAEEFDIMSKTFSSLGWEFGAAEASGHNQGELASASGKGPKSLENAGLTDEMSKMIKDAKGAMERLQQNSMKLIGKCSDQAAKMTFKTTVMEIKEWIAQNEHILTWQD